MKDYAGCSDKDEEIAAELKEAGISILQYEFLRKDHPEVFTSVRGDLHGWYFVRCWYYWSATGPGIPPKYATKLHEEFGEEIRVNGHCGCPHPNTLNGFAIRFYHIDTQKGLNAFAKLLNQIVNDNRKKEII